MKTKIFIAALLILFMAMAVQAAEIQKNLTFAWEQATADLPNLDKWKLHVLGSSGAPTAEQVINIPYTGGAGPSFQADSGFTITGNPGATVRKYFVLTAVSKNANESGRSNEVFFDFVIPYADVTTPINVTVTVKVQ